MNSAFLAIGLLLARTAWRQDRLVKRLHSLAAVDALTGLVTRRVLDDAAQAALSTTCEGVALAIIDIDFFKKINDRHGHPVGDAALIHVSRIVSSCAGEGADAARMGGDELALLMPGVNRQSALMVAQSLVAEVRDNPLANPGEDVVDLSISVGVGYATGSRISMRDLYEAADASLYEAKRSGRCRVGALAELKTTTGQSV